MSKPIAGDRVIDPNDQITINRILKTIRTKESGGNYQAVNKGDGVTVNIASGAYQFLNSTWRKLAAGKETAAGYPSAYQAPPNVQDFVAEAYVRSILSTHGYQLASIPVTWYYPSAWNNDALLDRVPAPNQGNTMTVRAYAEAWIKTFDGVAPDTNITAPQLVPDTNSPMSIWDTVLYGFTHPQDAVKNPLDAMKAIAEMLAVFGRFISNPNSWVRILKVIGGLVAIGMGMWIITHEQPVAAGKALVGKAATAAAVL